jgi:hypothetical protein
VPEEIDEVGGNEQKKVRQYVVSRVGLREGDLRGCVFCGSRVGPWKGYSAWMLFLRMMDRRGLSVPGVVAYSISTSNHSGQR